MNPYFRHLTDRLSANDAEAIETCIEFIEADTKEIGHGRLRALMSRRLKHCTLHRRQQNRLVRCITQRLQSGNFSQQFKDQLRLALFLEPKSTFEAARKSRHDSRDYVRRYAEWILAHEVLPQQ